jgi:hypothetical protein
MYIITKEKPGDKSFFRIIRAVRFFGDSIQIYLSVFGNNAG